MSTSGDHAVLASERRGSVTRYVVPGLAVALMVLAGLSTALGSPDTAIRFVSFATMIAAVVTGVVAVRRGPAGMRAVSAVVAVMALMLGSTFFGLTYS